MIILMVSNGGGVALTLHSVPAATVHSVSGRQFCAMRALFVL